MTVVIGVISDTHGLLRPEALEALDGSALIIHAGDVGNPAILDRLEEIAPVTVVQGNVDRAPWSASLPNTAVLSAAGHDLCVIHILEELDLVPEVAGFSAVIYGHTHRPNVEYKHGVLFLNPGSAGPRRFDLPVTVARLEVGMGPPRAAIIPLSIPRLG